MPSYHYSDFFRRDLGEDTHDTGSFDFSDESVDSTELGRNYRTRRGDGHSRGHPRDAEPPLPTQIGRDYRVDRYSGNFTYNHSHTSHYSSPDHEQRLPRHPSTLSQVRPPTPFRLEGRQRHQLPHERGISYPRAHEPANTTPSPHLRSAGHTPYRHQHQRFLSNERNGSLHSRPQGSTYRQEESQPSTRALSFSHLNNGIEVLPALRRESWWPDADSELPDEDFFSHPGAALRRGGVQIEGSLVRENVVTNNWSEQEQEAGAEDSSTRRRFSRTTPPPPSLSSSIGSYGSGSFRLPYTPPILTLIDLPLSITQNVPSGTFYEVLEVQIRSLIQHGLPPGTTATSTEGQMLHTHDFLPPQVQVAGYWLRSRSRAERVLAYIPHFYPSGTVPADVFMVIHAPHDHETDATQEVTRVVRFGRGVPDGDVFLDPFTADSLLTLIERNGFVPDIDIEHLTFWPPNVESAAGVPPVSEGALASLSERRLQASEFGDEGPTTCGICLDEKQVGDEVTVLPCGHFFDEECVGTWLKQNGTCPTCRSVVEKD